jgi:hypothetical protein
VADQVDARPGTGSPRGIAAVRFHDEQDGSYSMAEASHLRYWNTGTLAWERATGTAGAISTSSGGGGGAATIADGADVAEGTTTDASSANTVIGLLKNIKAALAGTLTTNATLSAETTKVIGTVNQGTSPWTVGSHAVTNAGTFATQSKLIDTGGVNAASVSAAGRLSVDASGVAVPVTDNSGSLTVDAPVGTPAFVRLSDGAAAITALPVTDNSGSLTVDAPVGTPVFVRLSDGAATLIGQKAMTASVPVVLASDQASVPVAATLSAETTKVVGTVNIAAAQSIAATQSGTWTVQPGNTPNTSPWLMSVHDGTTKAKVTVVNAQPAGSGRRVARQCDQHGCGDSAYVGVSWRGDRQHRPCELQRQGHPCVAGPHRVGRLVGLPVLDPGEGSGVRQVRHDPCLRRYRRRYQLNRDSEADGVSGADGRSERDGV